MQSQTTTVAAWLDGWAGEWDGGTSEGELLNSLMDPSPSVRTLLRVPAPTPPRPSRSGCFAICHAPLFCAGRATGWRKMAARPIARISKPAGIIKPSPPTAQKSAVLIKTPCPHCPHLFDVRRLLAPLRAAQRHRPSPLGQDASLQAEAIFFPPRRASTVLSRHEARLLSEGAAAATSAGRRESEATARQICSDQRGRDFDECCSLGAPERV